MNELKLDQADGRHSRAYLCDSAGGLTHKLIVGIQDEYIKYTAAVSWKRQASTTFVFARFEGVSFRHDLFPALFRLALPSHFLEFKSGKMGVPLVLDVNTSVSWNAIGWVYVYTLDLNLNPIEEIRETNWSTFSNRLETSAILSCPL